MFSKRTEPKNIHTNVGRPGKHAPPVGTYDVKRLFDSTATGGLVSSDEEADDDQKIHTEKRANKTSSGAFFPRGSSKRLSISPTSSRCTFGISHEYYKYVVLGSE